tara:strand:+ start:19142 stop:19420 length:279 start_codon:yes stop_codon:yes gene_type:complete
MKINQLFPEKVVNKILEINTNLRVDLNTICPFSRGDNEKIYKLGESKTGIVITIIVNIYNGYQSYIFKYDTREGLKVKSLNSYDSKYFCEKH